MNGSSKERSGRSMFRNIFMLAVGIAIGMLFSPDTGRANRAKVRQRFESWRADLRKEESRLIGRTTYERGKMAGVFHDIGKRLHFVRERESLDDVVNQRVRTELGENPQTSHIPRLNIDTYQGIVTLRGLVKNEQESHFVENIAKNVTGVKEVSNMLHFEEAASTG